MYTLADKDSVIGTPFWMSPEVISKSKYNKKTGKIFNKIFGRWELHVLSLQRENHLFHIFIQ